MRNAFYLVLLLLFDRHPSLFLCLISISSFFLCASDEYTLDLDYAIAATTQFQKLGVRGVSVLFSSGEFTERADTGISIDSSLVLIPRSGFRAEDRVAFLWREYCV